MKIRHRKKDTLTMINAKQVAQRATFAHLRANFTFSYCKSMGDDDPRGLANLDTRGMKDLCWVPLIIATHKILKLLTSWFQRRFFYVFLL